MTYRILNTLGDKFAPQASAILDRLGNVDYRIVTQDEFERIAPLYDFIVVGITPVVNRRVLEASTKLKAVIIPANTLENIDVEYAEAKKVAVVSLWDETEFLNTITGTAELACGLMIDIVRFTPWAFDSVKNHEFDRERFRGHSLYGKTLGIVGLGRLGRWMARYGAAFGMPVIFYSPDTPEDPALNYRKVNFDELLAESDVISLHAHLNAQTENMFNEDAFAKMKKGVFLVNTARGKIVDEGALLRALQSGQVAGYATDVLARELELGKTFGDYPLVEYAKTHRNVIIVPHIGGMTHESRENTDIFVVKKFQDFLAQQA